MNIIGAPFNSAGRPGGVAHAPHALREVGLITLLQQPDPAADPAHPTAAPGVRDTGDVNVGIPRPERDPRCGLRALDSLQVMTASLRDAVAQSIRGGDCTLVIGGDCPVLLGCLRGAGDAVGEVGLVFIDGHQDAWPPAASTTGEAADCELGLALGLHRENLPPSLTRLGRHAVMAIRPRWAASTRVVPIPHIGSITRSSGWV